MIPHEGYKPRDFFDSLVPHLTALKAGNRKDNQAVRFLNLFAEEIAKALPKRHSKLLAVSYFYDHAQGFVSRAGYSSKDDLELDYQQATR